MNKLGYVNQLSTQPDTCAASCTRRGESGCMDHSRGLELYYGGSPKQYEYSPKQLKSRSGQEFLGLSRCAACYNHNTSFTHWRGGDGESSSSAEDSESEADCESEAESGSSSSCSRYIIAAAPEKPETERDSPVCTDAAEPECGGEDGDGQKEMGDASQSLEDKNSSKGTSQRVPLVKSLSLPSTPTPHLTPLPLLPRPLRIISTLHLQVLPEKHDGDTSFTIRQHVPEREQENTGQSNGRGEGRMNNPPQQFQRQQMGLPWQQRSQPLEQHQYQHQLPQYFPPFTAQSTILPPPLHTLPVLHPLTPHTHLLAPNAPQTHVHTLTPQPCWYCYQLQFPHTSWSHYNSEQLARW